MDDKESAIRQKAYELWEKSGRPHGRHEEHWHQAAAEVGKTAPKPSVPVTASAPGIPASVAAPSKPAATIAPTPAAKAAPAKPAKAAAALATPSPVRRKK